MRATYLRGPSVNEESRMNLHLAQLEELHAQAMRDLQILTDQGQEADQLVAELSNLAVEISVLRGDVQTTPNDDTAIVAWHQRADALQLRIDKFVRMTSTTRAKAVEGTQFRGLWWGVGAAVAITVIGVVIWRGRKYRRKG